MISVIICSINDILAAQVKKNIDETIGVPWELILLNNTETKAGITTVYNKGAEQANFDILCFVHEDVLFNTPNWGQKIVGYFGADPSLGLVGLAGAKYKSSTLSGWSTGIHGFDCCNILHINKNKEQLKIYVNPDPAIHLQEVRVMDGVFMCTTKKVWQQVKFNESLITGFHLYDIEFSFAVSALYKALVTYDIDLVHLTEGGDYGNKWLTYTMLWHQARAAMLPVSDGTMGLAAQRKIERTIKRNWLHRLKREKITLGNKIKWIWVTNSWSSPALWPHIFVFFFFRLYRKV